MENLSNRKRTRSSSFPLETSSLAKKERKMFPTSSGDVQSHFDEVFQSPTVNPDEIPKFDIESQASGFQEWRLQLEAFEDLTGKGQKKDVELI